MATPDDVDRIIEQWRRERPELDLAAMATFGRLGRLFAHLGRAVDETFTRFDLQRGEYDVLAALRRSGAPFVLTPSALSDVLMLSRAGMTNRLDRLEAAGLVERRANRSDRRSMLIALTETGATLTDEVTTLHVANESALLSDLTPDERHHLDTITRKLLSRFE
ncbi:MarR family winged helix-turn-helix transcriptional regulator [Dactylosporangium siamense]|uniref:MarR family transcriptional regulator n=1 Tax=Dactylosporangium siamense TaxID=685454 RepID=A0A919PRU4_9ACTN|nr:MarR family transcriptional regulator [Dactylosporangium siamense]GIG49471.1 MarR family transcriptional regulator [Dactylosporangium siamense]